jgi:signal transduction histidine kinase
MKLVPKLTSALIVAVTAVLVLSAWIRVRGDKSLFAADMRKDHHVVGHLLSKTVADAWAQGGREASLEVVRRSSTSDSRIQFRLVDGHRPDGLPEVPVDLARVPPDGTSLEGGTGLDFLYTYVPVHVPAPAVAPPVLLELKEPLDQERAFVNGAALSTAATTLAMIAVCALTAALLGAWLVGRPIAAIAAKARRTGQGDFTEPLVIEHGDELGDLAIEMNRMCERLARAHDDVVSHMAARIAAIEQLRHADRLATVGRLAAGVAHELGTPLAVIRGRAEMISGREVQGDAVLQSARVVEEQADRMTRIVRHLLDFARRSCGKKRPMELDDVLQSLVSVLSPIADKRRVTLRVHEPVAPAIVSGDAAQLVQVFTNLLMNALDPSVGASSVELQVERVPGCPPGLARGVAGTYWRIDVIDDGSGIPESDLAHVFEPFYTTKQVGQGTGLGLSVAQGIVSDHRGFIDVRSQAGEGTTFSVYLPVAGEDDEGAAELAERAA